MPRRLSLILLLFVAAAWPVSTRPQETAAVGIAGHLQSLSAFEYSTRMNAARMLRRAPASDVVPALIEAAREHDDQFVRYRALVLLTSFNDPRTPALMRSLVIDRNDRVREVVYRWYERRPAVELTPVLLAALNIEQSEFVRPALIRAAAALPPNDRVQRALVGEIGRGFDFFRSAVIDALGRHRATYAVDALMPLAEADGILQDDAVLALGRIGDRRALSVLAGITASPAVEPALQAAQCLLGDACADRIAWLATSARSPGTRPDAASAAIAALAALAEANDRARVAVVELADTVPAPLRRDVALGLSGVALRDPPATMTWLTGIPVDMRSRVLDLLQEGFERLEEDFAEEQFFAAARAAYWQAAEGSPARTVIAGAIDALEF